MRTFAILSGLVAVCSALPVSSSGCTSELLCDSSTTPLDPRSDVCLAEMCADGSQAAALKRDTSTPSKASVYRDLSNSERLARGIPLKRPVLRKRGTGTGALYPKRSPSPTYTVKGHLLVRNANDGTTLGYASNVSFGNGYYYKPDIADALALSITLDVGSTSGTQLNVAQLNAPNVFPYFGLAQGRDSTSNDISTGSFNYLYFGGTDETPAGSTPQEIDNQAASSLRVARSSESAIWAIDILSGTAVPTWINSDGAAATTQLFTQSNGLYAGGDRDQFAAKYPSPVTPITFTWVSSA
ncbi:hypothetical protein GGX14DRAFT_578742 [Mycena pura]|uniref:Uncharacterized protein n=1 Tax=Mycena pura TaxID=153505 RepID=A0AAD6UTH2_9AGAR|nr:hypothetical protein GGX14DRAFT_578742 [Mycena pura]